MQTIEVLDPRGALRVTEQPLANRNGKLARTRIGFLSNKKANATLLLQEIERLLHERFGDFEAIYGEKGAAVPVPPEFLAELETCSAVLTGMADCGSCTSWSLHDAVVLEGKGIPSVLLCTDEFAPLARAESVAKGMGGLPLAVIPHPLADNRPHEVRTKAERIADEIVAILTRDASELDAQYRPLYHRLAQTRLKQSATCVDDVCIADPSGGAVQPAA
ncbi:MAG: hypothetical protein FJ148_13120 [Deltaproteobacteria bacterium]|nr:hypothetical protein [Deltaproteobacteria bacterium]